MHGMTACWFCRDPVEAEPVVHRAEPVAPDVAEPAEPAPVVTESMPEVVPEAAPPPGFVPRRFRFSFRRALLRGVALAVLVTLAALWLESMPPRVEGVPATTQLERRGFRALGFSIEAPRVWDVREGGQGVVFTGPEQVDDRSMRGCVVSWDATTFGRLATGLDDLNAERFDDYRVISTRETRLLGKRTRVEQFVADGLRFDQWWVDQGKRTLRLEFWSPLTDDDAATLNERIARTLRVR